MSVESSLPTVEPVRPLPLWRNVYDAMMQEGLEANKMWPIQFFVDGLSAPDGSMQLAMGIHEIRKALRRDGWVLTSRGQKGAQYFLAPRGQNADEMKRLGNLAMNSLKEGVILGTHTPLDSLTEGERQRHEAVLEKMAKRAALLSRNVPELEG